MVDEPTHQADRETFDEVESIEGGLGPLYNAQSCHSSPVNFQSSRNKVRTAALWGLRLRTRLMHDGASVTLSDAVRRHRGEANSAARRFEHLSPADREALLEFLRSI